MDAEEERTRNARDARNSLNRQLASKRKAKNRRRTGYHYSDRTPSTVQRKRTGDWHDLRIPEKFCLDNNYDETVEVIRELRSLALRQRKPVRLNFIDAKSISAGALLLLLAETHRCRIVRGPKLVSGTYPRDQKLEKTLCATGFYDMLGVNNRIAAQRTYPMNYIKFSSAAKLKEHQARTLRNELLGDKIEMQVRPRKRLQRAITEAMLNAVQHAYPKGSLKTNPSRNRWWLGGTYNRKTKDLTITFCDLGVGIPETVTKLYLLEHIRSVLSLLPGLEISDGQMILAAMQLGRTRTGTQGRGKGLNDLKKFVEQAGAGELKIFSKKGVYTFCADGSENVENHKLSIGGTLIKWRVPLENVTDWSENEEQTEEDTEDEQ